MTALPAPLTTAPRAAAAPALPVADIAAHRPLDLRSVRLTTGTLADWQSLNAAATIPHCIENLETSGVIDNLRRVVGESGAEYRGFVFADSDLYKVIEAVAWEIARTGTTAPRQRPDQDHHERDRHDDPGQHHRGPRRQRQT